MGESLAEFFLEYFRMHGRECAYRQRSGYRMEAFTYSRVVDMAFSFAGELRARGIGKGDRVILWGENCAEWVAAFFGCVISGVIVVPMDDGAAADFALRVFRQVEAKLLVGSGRRIQACSAAGLSGATMDLRDIAHAPDSYAAEPENIRIDREDVLQIVFTSGTTSEPRGVVITHGNVLANIAPVEREMRRYLKYERLVHPLRFLNLLPLSHVFGQFLGLFLPPLLGGAVIFQEELKPSEIVNTVRRERVSVVVSVPRVLESLKQKIEREVEDRGEAEKFRRRFAAAEKKHSLRRWWIFRDVRREFGWKFLAFISGGAALDRETEEFWMRLGYAVIQGYGLTETTSLVSVNHPFKLGKGSIGKALPGREVKLADDGEILVRGAGVASGYWNRDGARGAADGDGWYRTGDIGALDADGNLYFKGRKKEVIVIASGMNVYPEDLEAALRRQPEVRDCVVVGMDRGGNAEACAVVILRESGDLGAAVRQANEGLAEYQRMRMWVEWKDGDFPRTGTLKPQRRVIAEAVQEMLRSRTPTEFPPLERHEGRGTRELIARITKRGDVDVREDSRLDLDLGLSSLDRVELMGALEDRYQVDLSEARFSAVKTVGDLEKMLRGEAAPGAGYHYPRWTLRWPVRWVRLAVHYLLIRPAIVLLGWPRIEGRENLRGVKGPLLVVANHVSDVDAGFILTALPKRWRHRLATAAGGEALEALRVPPDGRNFFLKIYDRMQWVLGVSLLNVFPLPREAGFRRSFAYAGEAVDRGYSILVFPEGRHTTDGKLNSFRAGIGLLAQNLAIPVLPMRIDGLFERKSAGKKFAPPRTICVRIGKPMTFAAGMDAAAIAQELQEAVEEL